MILTHEQVPNICDGCGKRTTIVHFHTRTDEWVALCCDCQEAVTSLIFSTATSNRLASIMNGLREKHGQDNLHP